MPRTKESGSERLNRLALEVVDRVQRSQDSLYPYFNTHDLKEFAEAYLALVAERDALRETLKRIAHYDLDEAIRHVLNDSPGTPDSVKQYLRKALERTE